jgi:uncharacterized protein (TIGR03086 family)
VRVVEGVRPHQPHRRRAVLLRVDGQRRQAVAGPTRLSSGDFVGDFERGAEASIAAFSAPGATERTLRLPFAELPGVVFVRIAATDTFIHGWDLAKATGQPADLEPELASELLAGARTVLSDSLRGPDGEAWFGPEQAASPDATPADQLAAFLGRVVYI